VRNERNERNNIKYKTDDGRGNNVTKNALYKLSTKIYSIYK